MNTYKIATVSVALVIGIGTAAFAGPAGVSRPASSALQQNLMGELQAAAEESSHQAALTKGSGRQLYQMKTVELDDMIGRLKRGEQVSPAEVNKALRD